MILMNDFKAEPAELREEMLAAVERVLKSGWYVLGNEVVGFEKHWADICGVSHGVGVGSGMDAIELALRALNIGDGDEVITSPMTAFATVLAILRAGATPVLADIDNNSGLLSPDSTRRCITPSTKAILLVHLYGQVRQMDVWVDLCQKEDIQLVEDCAQAHMASWKGRVAGSFGAAGAYSFYPTKNLGAVGDAGMLVSDDSVIASRVAQLRNYGQSERYHHPHLGMNSRLDEVQAALLAVRSTRLAEFTQRRCEIAGAYRSGIKNDRVSHLAAPEEKYAHVYHLYVIMCDRREELQRHLQDKGVQTHIHYPLVIHRQEPCISLGRDPWGLENSEQHAATCLSLPCHPQMTNADVATVVAAVNMFQVR